MSVLNRLICCAVLTIGSLTTVLFSLPVAPASAASSCLSVNETLLLDRIDTFRDLNALPMFSASPTLTKAARHQAQSMADHGYFPDDYSVQFEGPDHDQTITWQQNIANAGYPDNTHTVRAEIIGSGTASVNSIAHTLAELPAYRSVLTDERFQAIGLGFGTGATGESYWVLTFGSLVDATISACDGTPIALALAGSGRSSNSSNSAAVIDGDLMTTWSTTAKTAPSNAYVWVDLGSAQAISRIEWMFAIAGEADSFAIDVSLDRVSWDQVALKGNGAVNEWRTVNWSGTTRYVRFYFANPNADPVIGGLAEVRIFR